MASSRRDAAVCALLLVLAACEREARPVTTGALPDARERVPLVTSGIVAGPDAPPIPAASPYADNAYVVAEGKRLYAWMNCAGCHGLNGGGGMGPPLADGDWIYGDGAPQVFQSVVQGRPNGMPAFPALSDDEVWKIVAYVRSLSPVSERATPGGAKPPSTGDAPPDPARTTDARR